LTLQCVILIKERINGLREIAKKIYGQKTEKLKQNFIYYF